VVLKPGTILSEQEFIQWLRDRLAHFKVPKLIVFVDEWPKTAANKVGKELLICQYGGVLELDPR
jgi:fatty-acyl-CoA synthase